MRHVLHRCFTKLVAEYRKAPEVTRQRRVLHQRPSMEPRPHARSTAGRSGAAEAVAGVEEPR